MKGGDPLEKQEFCRRLTQLRMEKGVSARDMSLSLGQSAGYVNNIENGVNLPSMQVFFYICDYFGITPAEFFDTGVASPERLSSLQKATRDLPPHKIELLISLAQAMA